MAGADEDGGEPGEVTVGETVTEGVVAGVLGTDGVTDVGETAGVVVVAVGVTDGVGVMLGVVEGAGVDVVAGGDWTGPTRLGPVLRWPVSIKAMASPTTTPNIRWRPNGTTSMLPTSTSPSRPGTL